MQSIEFSGYSVKAQFASDSPRQLLARPVSAMVGINDDAISLLLGLGIQTVQDLASSQLFDSVRRITQAARTPVGLADERLSGDVLDNTISVRTPREVAALPLENLRAVTPETAAAFQSAMGIQQIQELVAWPPYHTARQILNDAYGDSSVVLGDPERPDDLIPISRRYATERVQYDVVVMDKVIYDPDTASSTRTDLMQAGAIDIADVVSSALAARPAIGAVLTYRQSWYPQGLGLGHLLHSMALAPGESTRIAMVDWNRTVRGRSDDDTTQSESLISNIGRTRAMSEVTRSVAKEAQQGFSGSNSTANQEQSGETFGEASAGFTQPGIIGGIVPFLFGGEGARATTNSRGTSRASSTATTAATGWASSSGERSLNSEMIQNINDQTHQAANSVRNRRATAITETSQRESENLSTRVVTNYNHMHALTIQYFEVVQIYRVSVELARTTRCIFVPMKLVSFTWEVVQRFKDVIANAGLVADVQALRWLQPNQMLVTSPSRSGAWNRVQANVVAQALGDQVVPESGNALILPLAGLRILGLSIDPGRIFEVFDNLAFLFKDGTIVNIPLVSADQVMFTSWGAVLPTDGSLQANPSQAKDLRKIVLRRRSGREAENGSLTLGLAFDVDLPGNISATARVDTPWLRVTLPIEFKAEEPTTVALELTPSFAEADIIDHLQQNSLHYSSAIWRSLDSATITTMLSTYEFGGRPLIEVIDPVPVSMSGNYLIFRMYGDETGAEWQSFLKKHELMNPAPKEDWVPLPSGGVFAEAVLGRSNSAEKLDITRFWNWQDSPIPILPPEISPLTAGGKDNPPTTSTAPLEGSIVNIVNPPSLPDPAGLAPLYNAIANGNMFRDMSGLAQTAALAQAALQAAQAGAVDATSAAGQAQQVAATQLTEFLKLAAQVAMAAIGGGAGGALGAIGGGVSGAIGGKPGVTNTPTNAGALINHGKALDAAKDSAFVPSANSGGISPEADTDANSTSDKQNAETDAFNVALTGDRSGSGGLLGMLPSLIMGADPTGTSVDAGVQKQLSGPSWVTPPDRNTSSLTPTFQTACDEFISAIRNAGGDVDIAATYRTKERAYLMHYAWDISKNNIDPESVPSMKGVNIEWVHRDANGQKDLDQSKSMAAQMVKMYAMAAQAKLDTRHTERRAIDMTISWTGDLVIENKDKTIVTITSEPKSGMNSDLIAVGETYGVIKANFKGDPPHWSDDGK
jgi:hypothetical protein